MHRLPVVRHRTARRSCTGGTTTGWPGRPNNRGKPARDSGELYRPRVTQRPATQQRAVSDGLWSGFHPPRANRSVVAVVPSQAFRSTRLPKAS